MSTSTELRMASYTRQELILPSHVAGQAVVNIVGAGTVGSHAAVACADMGIPTLNIWDRDEVEAHNLPSQHYVLDDLGKSKVDALKAHVEAVNHNAQVTAHDRFFEASDPFPDGIVILALDSMEGRKAIFESSVKHYSNYPIMFDSRMGGNKLTIYAIDPSDHTMIENYIAGAHSYDDETAEPVPCGGRTVSYVGPIIGGLLANYVRLALMGKNKVPFLTEISLDTMAMTVLGGKEYGFGKI